MDYGLTGCKGWQDELVTLYIIIALRSMWRSFQRWIVIDQAVVIYDHCHRISIFKLRSFNLGWILLRLLFGHLLSTAWSPAGDKSQPLVFLSPALLCCSSDTVVLGWTPGAGGPASALELWLRDWVCFGSDTPLTFRPAVCSGATCCFYYLVLTVGP